MVISVLLVCSLSLKAESSSEGKQSAFSQGMVLFGEEEYEEALEKFLQVTKEEPQNANAYYYLGEVYSELGEYENAAGAYENALRLNPEFKDLHYKLGLAYYQMKEYQKAVGELEVAKLYKPEDAMVYYYAGLSYYNLKRYYKVPLLLKKAGELDSSLTIFCHYWTAVSLFNQGLYQKAKLYFLKVRDINPYSSEGKSAGEFLQVVEAQSRIFTFDINWDVEYDDNVTMQPDDEHIDTGVEGKEDWRTSISAKPRLRHFSKYGEVGGYYSFYQSYHQEPELFDYNLKGHTGSLYFSSDCRPVQPYVQYKYNYYFLKEKEYMESQDIMASLNIALIGGYTTQIYDQFTWENYLTFPDREEHEKDGKNNLLGINQYFPIMKDKGYVRVGGAYKQNWAEGSDWDYTSGRGSLSVYAPLPIKRTSFQLGTNYEDKNFGHTDSYFDQKRDDNKTTATLSLAHNLNKSWKVALTYTSIYNKSNIDFYTYTRNIYSLSWSYKY